MKVCYGLLLRTTPRWRDRARALRRTDFATSGSGRCSARTRRHSVPLRVAYRRVPRARAGRTRRAATRSARSRPTGDRRAARMEICCGSAGLYNVLQPDAAAAWAPKARACWTQGPRRRRGQRMRAADPFAPRGDGPPSSRVSPVELLWASIRGSTGPPVTVSPGGPSYARAGPYREESAVAERDGRSRPVCMGSAINMVTDIPGPRSAAVLARGEGVSAIRWTSTSPTVIHLGTRRTVHGPRRQRHADFSADSAASSSATRTRRWSRPCSSRRPASRAFDFSVIPYESYVQGRGARRPLGIPAPKSRLQLGRRGHRERRSSRGPRRARPAVISFEGAFRPRC
jgi:hypothetical protein